MGKWQKGFSLIELITVIIVIGVLSAIVAPMFVDLAPKAKSTAAVSGAGAVLAEFAILVTKKTPSNPGDPYPTLTELSAGAKRSTVASDGTGLCVGTGKISKTFTDEAGTVPTAAAGDVVRDVADAVAAVSEAVCP